MFRASAITKNCSYIFSRNGNCWYCDMLATYVTVRWTPSTVEIISKASLAILNVKTTVLRL